jgi:hypothetical protein
MSSTNPDSDPIADNDEPLGLPQPGAQQPYSEWGGETLSLLDYASNAVSVPKEYRGQKSFFRFLRKASVDPAILAEVQRLRDSVILSTVREKSSTGLTIGVTSPEGSEGASIIALLLSLSLGDCVYRRVAVMDGKFNVQRFQLLSDILGLSRNSVSLYKGSNEVVGYYNEAHPNVYFLRNAGAERSMQFFSDKRLPLFLGDLRQHFDFTVIDLPPLLKETASLFVAPHVDRLYIVAESGKTRLSQLGRAVQSVRQAGGQVSGIILNKQRAPLWSRFMWRDFFF